MRNMSRIRNTLRFQSPEERVLNGLLALVLVVLISVGIAKVRDDRIEAAPEVKGITVTREQPVRTVSRRPVSTSTTPTTPTTTGSISPADLLRLAAAMQADQRHRSNTSTTTAAPGWGFVSPTTRPAVVPTTRVTPTSTTTASTTTTTAPTTTSTTPGNPPITAG